MKKFYVEYKAQGGKTERSEYYDTYGEAFNRYLDIMESGRDSDWAESIYKNTKIMTRYC